MPTTTLYQVRDWDKHFENDRSRQRDRCSFVCVPNKQHGMGFCQLMNFPAGASHYGIWQMILGACSQQSRPRQGWLTDDGKPDGRPWQASDLAMKFRRPADEIQAALDALSSPGMGWLVAKVTADSPSGHRLVTADSPSTQVTVRTNVADSPPTHHALTADSPGMEGKEGKGMEGKEECGTLDLCFYLQDQIRIAYKQPNRGLSCLEQQCVAEISKRPGVRDELILLLAYRQKTDYFPKSITSLLEKWGKTVDEAINHDEKRNRNNPIGPDRNKGTFNEGKSGMYRNGAAISQTHAESLRNARRPAT